MNDDKLLYRIEEAAEALNIGRTVVYDLIRRNAIRSVKIGHARRIPRQALSEYVESLLEEAA